MSIKLKVVDDIQTPKSFRLCRGDIICSIEVLTRCAAHQQHAYSERFSHPIRPSQAVKIDLNFNCPGADRDIPPAVCVHIVCSRVGEGLELVAQGRA